MQMDDHNDNRKNTSFITLILTVVLVSIATLSLFGTFRKMRNSGSNYTLVSESVQINDTDEKRNAIPETVTFPVSISHTNDNEYIEDINLDFVEREFTVNEQIFYMMKDSKAPEEGDISAERAAEIGLAALTEYFPNESGKYPFHITLYYSSDAPLLHLMPNSSTTIWLIFMEDPEKNPNYGIIAIHPKTEKIIYIYCPKGKPYYVMDDYQQPSLSMQDFYNLSNDSFWFARGLKLIRENGLNGDEIVIRLDEEKGIHYTSAGEMVAEYYIGSNDGAKKIRIFMDLLTQELAGFFFYDNI